jgi:Protein of unknown function (DUF1566)
MLIRNAVGLLFGLILAVGGVVCEAQTVRAGDGRFHIKGAEVFDTETGLTWQRCSVGQHWDEVKGCVGTAKKMPFQKAQEQVQGNWRVPTEDELTTLIDKNRKFDSHKPAVDTVAFPGMDKGKLRYWSSSVGSSGNRSVAFGGSGGGGTGGTGDGGGRSINAVRLVRQGQ